MTDPRPVRHLAPRSGTRSARQRRERGTAAPIDTSPLLHPLPAGAGRGRTVGSGGALPIIRARSKHLGRAAGHFGRASDHFGRAPDHSGALPLISCVGWRPRCAV